jgi:hypothetical protein
LPRFLLFNIELSLKISLNVLVALFDKYGAAKRSSTDKAVDFNFGNRSAS